MPAPYVTRVTLKEEEPLDPGAFPGNLPFTQNLNLAFDSPVTCFVGENGSGKSTLIEALAVLARLPIAGGGTNEIGADQGEAESSVLANSLRMAFIKQPTDRYFFRAEAQANFAALLQQRQRDPNFRHAGGAPANPYASYGGRSLHQMSHGEAFLSVMQNRFRQGLFLMDEPESALSPQRQLTLLALMYQLVQSGATQIIAATHSPILLTYPGAAIISFEGGNLRRVKLEDTSHYQITRGILNEPQRYWRHLSQ